MLRGFSSHNCYEMVTLSTLVLIWGWVGGFIKLFLVALFDFFFTHLLVSLPYEKYVHSEQWFDSYLPLVDFF